MIRVEVHGADSAAARFQRAAKMIPDLARRTVEMASILIRRKLVARMSSKNAPRHPFWGKGSPPGAFLGARTGQTRARLSPAGKAVQRGNVWSATVGSPDRHVKLHEWGGTVQGGSPRGYLRIPTAAAQSASGAEQGRFAGRSLKAVPGVFLIRSKAGNLWAAERERRGKLRLLYLLKRSATMRPRGIFAAVAAEMEAEYQKLGATQMHTTLSAAGIA